MKWRAWVVVMVLAGCGDNLTGDDVVPLPDPPTDASTDAPVDAPVDGPPPTDLVTLCGSQPITFDDWEDCYQRRWCQTVVGCSPGNSYRDMQECIARSDDIVGGMFSAERRERGRAVEQGRASLDVAAFTQCLIDTSSAHCNTARFSVACATRFTGTIGDGGACYTDFECVSRGATCVADCTDACCPGTCRPKFELGQACDLFESCEPGLRCHATCLSGDIGSPCVNLRDCDQNAWCNAGTCTADRAPGDECWDLSECGGETTCVGLRIGNPTPGKCLSISKPGDRCDFVCYGNLYCDPTGTCRELPEIGQGCSSFVACRGVDSFCNNGLCAKRGGIGATCSNSKLCQRELFCTYELNDPAPTCVTRRDVGEPCAAPSHCQSYLCSGTSAQPGVCLRWSDTCPLGGS